MSFPPPDFQPSGAPEDHNIREHFRNITYRKSSSSLFFRTGLIPSKGFYKHFSFPEDFEDVTKS